MESKGLHYQETKKLQNKENTVVGDEEEKKQRTDRRGGDNSKRIYSNFMMESLRKNEICLDNYLREMGKYLKNSAFERIHNIPNFSEDSIEIALLGGDKYNLNLMQNINKLKIPNLANYHILKITYDKSWIKKITKNEFTSKIGNAFLSNRGVNPIRLFEIPKEIDQIFQRVLNSVAIDRFQISHRNLVRVFSLCRDKSELRFFDCIIYLKTVPDLAKALPTCNIQELEFDNCGGPLFGNWAQDPQQLDNLINGLAQCECLIQSLTKLIIRKSFLDKQVVVKAVKKYGLKDVELFV
ncbi:unnamed protein product [Moneuplotes crassus]|uniref:Uncharacterized protein n=1 Tax=Euplotes crassus TaxID=5936 RepID=A0AAD1XQQ3_EUPCR|nr:unnamed protein product [Moneuplotes crassus]